MAQKKIIGIFNLIICNFSYHSKGFLETSQLAVLLLIGNCNSFLRFMLGLVTTLNFHWFSVGLSSGLTQTNPQWLLFTPCLVFGVLSCMIPLNIIYGPTNVSICVHISVHPPQKRFLYSPMPMQDADEVCICWILTGWQVGWNKEGNNSTRTETKPFKVKKAQYGNHRQWLQWALSIVFDTCFHFSSLDLITSLFSMAE